MLSVNSKFINIHAKTKYCSLKNTNSQYNKREVRERLFMCKIPPSQTIINCAIQAKKYCKDTRKVNDRRYCVL